MNSPYSVSQPLPEYWSATEWIQLPLVLIMGAAFWSLQKQLHSARNWKASWKTVAGYPRSPVVSGYRILYNQELKITNKKFFGAIAVYVCSIRIPQFWVLQMLLVLSPHPPDHSGFSQPSTPSHRRNTDSMRWGEHTETTRLHHV